MHNSLRVELAGPVREGLLACGYTGEGELGRAFRLHEAVAEDVLRGVMGDGFFDTCDEAGLWKRVEGGVTGAVVIAVDEGRFLVSDHPAERVGELAKQWVMGVGASTMQVAHAVPQKQYGRVLDLCCGGGFQAFRLATFAREIVAVDRNPRAVNLGRFGAALNGFGHVTFREGDLFTAVAGEKFDLIVCNPPYVVSPERGRMYRDGGMDGDALAERIVRETPRYLNEGGCAYFVCDVATQGGVGALERLGEWAAGRGCDVVVIASPEMTPAAYTKLWGQVEGEWGKWFGELGIESITHLLVAMRRRAGDNWMTADALPKRTEGPFGAQMDRRFSGQDFARLGAAETWGARLRLVPEARLQRRVRAEGGRWVTEEAKILMAEGMMYEYVVDPRTVDFLAMFDGVLTVEEILGRLAGAMRMDVEKVREGWIGYVRQLAGDGILEVMV